MTGEGVPLHKGPNMVKCTISSPIPDTAIFTTLDHVTSDYVASM